MDLYKASVEIFSMTFVILAIETAILDNQAETLGNDPEAFAYFLNQLPNASKQL